MGHRGHPSRQPIRRQAQKGSGYYRPFRTGFLNERLNEPQKDFSPQAIGFLSPVEQVIYEEDVYARAKRR